MFGVRLLLLLVDTNTMLPLLTIILVFCWIYLLIHKSDVEQVFYAFHAHVASFRLQN
jgi:hypothetical protein